MKSKKRLELQNHIIDLLSRDVRNLDDDRLMAIEDHIEQGSFDVGAILYGGSYTNLETGEHIEE